MQIDAIFKAKVRKSGVDNVEEITIPTWVRNSLNILKGDTLYLEIKKIERKMGSKLRLAFGYPLGCD